MFKQETIEHRILRLVEQAGELNAADIAGKLGISTVVAVAHVNLLRERGYLRHSNAGILGVTYAVGPRFAEWRAANQTEEELRAQVKALEAALNLSTIALQNANMLLDELVAQDDGPFMVSVDGAAAPKHEHATEQDARNEALRLANLNTLYKSIRVLKVVDILKTETVTNRTWSSEEQADDESFSLRDAVAGMCDGNCEGCPNNA